jgi:CTP:molybdopterin cytidylyltransferase MocA
VIAGLLLASGASRRFGSNKLLVELGGRAVVRWSADALVSAVDRAFVVVPAAHEALWATLAGVVIERVVNHDAAEGLGSSIRAGVAALPADAEAVVITLADQPTIDPMVIGRVVARWREVGDDAVAVTTSYTDGRGHPTLFAASQLSALRTFAGDRGARSLLEALGARVAVVEVEAERPPDLDHPADLVRLSHAIARGG